MRWSQVGALLGFCLAALALLLLAISPLGWRAGWWHYRFAFTWLMPASGFIAAAATLISLLTLLLGWSGLCARRMAMAAVGLALGVALAYVPWHYNRLLNTLPRIHDITTDTENPPSFKTVLAARAAEKAATEVYEGPDLARLQKAAYPDLAPLELNSTAAQAFELALAVAKSMPGWSIVSVEPATGHIEASQASTWFGFTDDVVIRVTTDGSRSRIDMRSLSRQGRSDFGVNAARIRAYMSALKKHIG
jgi:uncharacterized protein (DUF1499 family)